MPKIIGARPIAAPPTSLQPPDSVNNRSPDGEWDLVFHTPREWHMGADGWQVKLFYRGHDVTRAHHDFFRIADGKGFRYEPHFQPWSFDSRSLAIVTWDGTPIHLYQPATRRAETLNYQPAFGFVYSAQWAPDIDRLLLTFPTDGGLVDQAGEQHGVVRWGIEERETPHTFWMRSGNCFFLLARQAGQSSTSIRFYSGVDGALKQTHELDPLELAPYNWRDYVQLPRDRWSLVSAEHGFRSVGSLLDTWSDVRFDRGLNMLSLGVFRPVSAPYRHGGELLCKVKQAWVAVKLDPD